MKALELSGDGSDNGKLVAAPTNGGVKRRRGSTRCEFFVKDGWFLAIRSREYANTGVSLLTAQQIAVTDKAFISSQLWLACYDLDSVLVSQTQGGIESTRTGVLMPVRSGWNSLCTLAGPRKA